MRTIADFKLPRTGRTALLLSATTELLVIDLIAQHDPQPDPQLAGRSHARFPLAVEPNNEGALWFLAFPLIGAERFDEAVETLERVASLSHRSSAVLGLLVHAYAHAGRRKEALQVLNELRQRRKAGYVPAAAFLNAYLGLGDKEEAFVWLERSIEERSKIIQFLKVQPFFDPLRCDPRFATFLRRANFQ